MKIEALQQIAKSSLPKPAASGAQKAETTKFSETLKGMIQQVDEAQDLSGKAIEDFVAGKDVELHEVMAIGEEAQISFQFMLKVRNKLIEGFQELSRMPT